MVAGKRFTYLWRSVFIVLSVTRHLVKQEQTRLLVGGMDGGGVRRFLFCQAVSQSRVLLLYIFSLPDFFMDIFSQIIIYSLGNRAIKQNTELAKKYKKIKNKKQKTSGSCYFPPNFRLDMITSFFTSARLFTFATQNLHFSYGF